VSHKRTFFFLEQLILKHNAHEQVTKSCHSPGTLILVIDEIYSWTSLSLDTCNHVGHQYPGGPRRDRLLLRKPTGIDQTRGLCLGHRAYQVRCGIALSFALQLNQQMLACNASVKCSLTLPCSSASRRNRTKTSERLISGDEHTGKAKMKWTFSTEIAPICKVRQPVTTLRSRGVRKLTHEVAPYRRRISFACLVGCLRIWEALGKLPYTIDTAAPSPIHIAVVAVPWCCVHERQVGWDL
jgi:hypothetical protein